MPEAWENSSWYPYSTENAYALPPGNIRRTGSARDFSSQYPPQTTFMPAIPPDYGSVPPYVPAPGPAPGSEPRALSPTEPLVGMPPSATAPGAASPGAPESMRPEPGLFGATSALPPPAPSYPYGTYPYGAALPEGAYGMGGGLPTSPSGTTASPADLSPASTLGGTDLAGDMFGTGSSLGAPPMPGGAYGSLASPAPYGYGGYPGGASSPRY